MQLPALTEPERYAGLYVFDFGEWTAVGYTADEVAMLLESEQYQSGQVYKIHRVTPDGQMEVRGVARERFLLESAMCFDRDDLDAARDDFAQLRASADETTPPCRVAVYLADRGADVVGPRYLTTMIYPAEFEDEIGRWLLNIGYEGGDTVEGGPSHVTNYDEDDKRVLERAQLWSKTAIPSRSHDQVFASVRQAVQR
ncbi:MAG: hypothetical protein JXO22_05900 [Phycisphaerae bacterium]|nr:hypothetical protein [Phycisphaerae bacterium]